MYASVTEGRDLARGHDRLAFLDLDLVRVLQGSRRHYLTQYRSETVPIHRDRRVRCSRLCGEREVSSSDLCRSPLGPCARESWAGISADRRRACRAPRPVSRRRRRRLSAYTSRRRRSNSSIDDRATSTRRALLEIVATTSAPSSTPSIVAASRRVTYSRTCYRRAPQRPLGQHRTGAQQLVATRRVHSDRAGLGRCPAIRWPPAEPRPGVSAWSVTGPYGAGNPRFAHFHLCSARGHGQDTGAAGCLASMITGGRRARAIASELREALGRLARPTGGHPCGQRPPNVSRSASPSRAPFIEVRRTYWGGRRGRRPGCFKELHAATGDHCSARSITPTPGLFRLPLEHLIVGAPCDRARRARKALEYAADRSREADLYLLQQTRRAVLMVATADVRCVLALQHLAFEDYASGLSPSASKGVAQDSGTLRGNAPSPAGQPRR